MREIKKERERKSAGTSCARVVLLLLGLWYYCTCHTHTRTQPEGGNAIKYAKFYASANENSKRQSADKSRRSRRSSRRRWSMRGKRSPQCRYVCAQRRMPMHILPLPPLLGCGKICQLRLERHGSHGVCVIFVYDLPCQLESNLHICTRAKMHWNVRPESATACSHKHTRTHKHTPNTHTERKTAMRSGDKQPLTSYDERVVWSCPCRHLLPDASYLLSCYLLLSSSSHLFLSPPSPSPLAVIVIAFGNMNGMWHSLFLFVPLYLPLTRTLPRRELASAWFYTF